MTTTTTAAVAAQHLASLRAAHETPLRAVLAQSLTPTPLCPGCGFDPNEVEVGYQPERCPCCGERPAGQVD